jgi:purine-binding chemotaxis protein CheW
MDRHIVFHVERELFALPLAAVREVVVPGTLSRVPRSPEAVRGIMNLRGRIVTVIDMRILLGLGVPDAEEANPTGKLVILDRGRRDLGLLVGEVEGIVSIPQVTPAAGGSKSVLGVATISGSEGGSRVITVFDPDALDVQVGDLFGSPPGRRI